MLAKSLFGIIVPPIRNKNSPNRKLAISLPARKHPSVVTLILSDHPEACLSLLRLKRTSIRPLGQHRI